MVIEARRRQAGEREDDVTVLALMLGLEQAGFLTREKAVPPRGFPRRGGLFV